jgi:hypothetical protein
MTAPTRRTVSIGDIQVPSGKRAPNTKTIERLAESIKALGLLNPILVRAAGPCAVDGTSQNRPMILFAGQHRLEARSPSGCAWDDEDTQLRNLEAAWNAASEGARVAFGFEVLGLGQRAYLLPKKVKRPAIAA